MYFETRSLPKIHAETALSFHLISGALWIGVRYRLDQSSALHLSLAPLLFPMSWWCQHLQFFILLQ